MYDHDPPYQINVNVVSRATETRSLSKGVTLLCSRDPGSFERQVETLLVQRDFHVDFTNINQVPPANQDIISLLDINGPFFDEISSEELAAFQSYIGSLRSSGILWTTRSSQIRCDDPRYAQVLGAARTIRSELLISFATCEIDTVDEGALEALVNVFDKFRRRTRDAEVDPDWEFALSEKVVYLPRYRWISVVEQLSAVSDMELPRKLETGKPGLLQSLRWIQTAPIRLTNDQIEVEVCAVGLNFKVVALSL